ncbi:MAG: FAD-binding oxidoreductase [Anaerolineae bacterium]|nr:FAD-binding oxidoreductase [Anaerolineae bacterium]
MNTYTRLTDQHLAAITQIVGVERFSTRSADLDLHARDQSFHEAHPPEAVVWPETTAEVSALLKLANAERIPVTAWGAGSSLEGNPIPVYGGLLVDFTRMNRIVNIRAEDFQADVQPGITRLELNKELSRYGLFYPPDPGANATIGGMVANNSSGIKTIKYGATKDNVMRLEVVKADGEAIIVGSRARKDSSGYDLLHLFVGSEGTLGLVTEVTLKLHPLPANFSAVLAAFNDIESVMQTVVDIVGAGLEPSALEFLDTETARILNQDKHLGLLETPHVLMEFNGASDDAGLNDALDICKANGATNIKTAAGQEERNKLWQARHHTYETILRIHPGKAQQIVDVCVPLSRFPDMVQFAGQALADNNLFGYKFGHAGDGNLHMNIIYDQSNAAELALVKRVNGVIVEHAIELEGTSTGEHGTGIGKRPYAVKQHGAAIEVMRQIKQLLDPNGILNPGKIFL